MLHESSSLAWLLDMARKASILPPRLPFCTLRVVSAERVEHFAAALATLSQRFTVVRKQISKLDGTFLAHLQLDLFISLWFGICVDIS